MSRRQHGQMAEQKSACDYRTCASSFLSYPSFCFEPLCRLGQEVKEHLGCHRRNFYGSIEHHQDTSTTVSSRKTFSERSGRGSGDQKHTETNSGHLRQQAPRPRLGFSHETCFIPFLPAGCFSSQLASLEPYSMRIERPGLLAESTSWTVPSQVGYSWHGHPVDRMAGYRHLLQR